jgi:hypothetical protein
MEIRKFVGNTHSVLKDLKAELRIKDLQLDLHCHFLDYLRRDCTPLITMP